MCSLNIVGFSDKRHFWLTRTQLSVVYGNLLKAFDEVWCIKGLIATRSNLVVSWQCRPNIGFITQRHVYPLDEFPTTF